MLCDDSKAVKYFRQKGLGRRMREIAGTRERKQVGGRDDMRTFGISDCVGFGQGSSLVFRVLYPDNFINMVASSMPQTSKLLA